MSEDDEDLPRLLGDRYRLEAVVGHGGMGVVYQGVDQMMKRPIAVKLIRAIDGIELDDEVAGRFLREAKNTARVQHPHIVQVFDLGRTNEGALYLVMELLEGESLSARMKRDGVLRPASAVHIVGQICEALQVAHNAGVIHRDLKPANIMLLRRAGNDSFVKVLDFGVAKSYSPDQQTQLTSVGMLVGTVDYMAPEQIMGKVVDGRADIYSLGIVLYKMLAGRAPFRDAGVPALIHAHLNTMPSPLIEVANGVPNDLDRVVLRCLAKEPERRYESMAELARALSEAVPVDDRASPPPRHRFQAQGEAPIPAPVSTPAPAPAPPIHNAYESGDDNPTLARPVSSAPDLPVPEVPEAPPAEDPADDDAFVARFDDATLKMDRTLGFKKPNPARRPLPMTPRGLGGARRESRPLYPGGPEDPARGGEPKLCVMCQTLNVAHARVCAACGVSLAPEEQAALQARLRAIPQTSSAPPPMPPVTGPLPLLYDAPVTGPLPLLTGPLPPSTAYDAMARRPAVTGPHMPPPNHAGPRAPALTGPHAPSPTGSHVWPAHPPVQPPSMWHRFLAWTGLRSR